MFFSPLGVRFVCGLRYTRVQYIFNNFHVIFSFSLNIHLESRSLIRMSTRVHAPNNTIKQYLGILNPPSVNNKTNSNAGRLATTRRMGQCFQSETTVFDGAQNAVRSE